MFNSIPEIIEDIRVGKMVILMDDEGRENEGDLVLAAEKVTPELVNFMARYGRGLMCVTLTRERCEALNLPLMTRSGTSGHQTNFTVSIEAAQGVTTGISAADRATTILAAVAKEAKPANLVQPGHIFPLMANPGGVLSRAGHTEAGCDLARLAGCEPASVIIEILNDDGSMARRPELEVFAKEHGLKMGSIADLISYRLAHEKSVERVGTQILPTEYGEFTMTLFKDNASEKIHIALTMGDITPDEAVPVRVHLPDTLGDLLGCQLPQCGMPLRAAMKYIASQGRGVIVVLRENDTDVALLQALANDEDVVPSQPQPDDAPSSSDDLKTYGVGAQILLELGVKKMQVLSAPKKIHGLSGFGLEVVEYISDF